MISRNQMIKYLLHKITEYRVGYAKLRKKNPQLSNISILFKGVLVHPKDSLYYIDDYVRQFVIITKRIKIEKGQRYIYPFDPLILRMHKRTVISSMTVDFKKILESNLDIIRSHIKVCRDKEFASRELAIIESIEILAKRISGTLKKSKDSRSRELCSFFTSLLYKRPQSLDEAVQKLLFYDALFWQMGHYHIGLGRLDLILMPYYDNDIKNGNLTYAEAKDIITQLVLILGKDTVAKSPSLIGDTGQYILLGGKDQDGNNIDNSLTELFLEVFTELRIPDPKLILRVNEKTSKKVWEKSIECILTGIGSPLLMNENVIMNKMIRFGYSTKDIWNVGTSACWEPLIIGKSFDQNNPFKSAVAIRPLNKIISGSENFSSFQDLIDSYKKEYAKEINRVVKDLDFDCSPLFTLFFDDCLEREKDFTLGGAIYAYHGAQIVSFPNTVNALLNIKRLVFEEKKYTMSDCRSAINNNFESMEDFRILLATTGKKFGSTDSEVLELTNDLIGFTSDVVEKLKSNGRSIKVGFSSPNYILESKSEGASLDGRKKGDPYAVHISPQSSMIDISEVLDFSTKLVFKDNCINGNVVDFIIPSSYINNKEKLLGLLKDACSRGIFELQLNVLDKETLLDAKKHPEKYPNLVVRVWGFSAYFNDLPEEFKDNLIRRAEMYEAA